MITLTCGSKSVSFDRGADPTSESWIEALNQFSKQTVSGNIISYSSGIGMLHGILVIKCVTHEQAMAFRDFVVGDIRFTLKQFSIIANACDDLGIGLGNPLTVCKLDGVTSTKDLMKPRVGGKWDISIPYICRLNGSGGLGEI